MTIRHLLLVDDSLDDLAMCERMLKAAGAGATIHTAGGGQQALDLLDGSFRMPRLDLIITDWVMPGIGGEQVVRHIRSLPQLATVPILVLTASDIAREVSRAYAAGANTVITKPHGPDGYQACFSTMLAYWTQVAALPRSV